MKPEWFPDWSEEACAIVASGPSVRADDVSSLQDRCRVIVVNNGYLLAPWADVLYAADGRWWDTHERARSFGGLKVTPDRPASVKHGIALVGLVTGGEVEESRLSGEPGILGRGGHSGFQALNLALQFGARKILLVGFDFRGEHWHGPHPDPLRNPRPGTLARWASILDAQASKIARLGAEVVNTSELSVLQNYRLASIEESLSGWMRKQAA